MELEVSRILEGSIDNKRHQQNKGLAIVAIPLF